MEEAVCMPFSTWGKTSASLVSGRLLNFLAGQVIDGRILGAICLGWCLGCSWKFDLLRLLESYTLPFRPLCYLIGTAK
jgi:hypothetical protein